MGPVDWIAVAVAAALAFALGGLWYGPLFGPAKRAGVGPRGRSPLPAPRRTMAITLALLLVAAAMLGHMYARVGAETLGAKPWLYFMMSGGLALAFVLPALLTSYMHQRIAPVVALIDAGYWLLAYLTMGTAFWMLG